MLKLLKRVNARLGLKYRVDFIRNYIAAFGVGEAIRIRRLLSTRTAGSTSATILPPGWRSPIHLRPGTADMSTFEKVFVWREYDLAFPDNVRWIVDCGANIGLSALWFAERFPAARVLAIEPNSDNFRLLLRNTELCPNVVPLQAAVWRRCCQLVPQSETARVDSFRYTDMGAGQLNASTVVAAYDIGTLLEEYDIRAIDILKVDIEGAETEVFQPGCESWLERVRMVVIELHGAEADRQLSAAMHPDCWHRSKRGETDVLVRDRGSQG